MSHFNPYSGPIGNIKKMEAVSAGNVPVVRERVVPADEIPADVRAKVETALNTQTRNAVVEKMLAQPSTYMGSFEIASCGGPLATIDGIAERFDAYLNKLSEHRKPATTPVTETTIAQATFKKPTGYSI